MLPVVAKAGWRWRFRGLRPPRHLRRRRGSFLDHCRSGVDRAWSQGDPQCSLYRDAQQGVARADRLHQLPCPVWREAGKGDWQSHCRCPDDCPREVGKRCRCPKVYWPGAYLESRVRDCHCWRAIAKASRHCFRFLLRVETHCLWTVLSNYRCRRRVLSNCRCRSKAGNSCRCSPRAGNNSHRRRAWSSCRPRHSIVPRPHRRVPRLPVHRPSQLPETRRAPRLPPTSK